MVLSPTGGFSVRKFLLFVATLVVTVFAYLFVSAPTAHAAEGKWDNGAIVYEGKKFERIDAAKVEGAPATAKFYRYVDPGQMTQEDRVASLIYFEPNADPLTSKTAKYAVYKYTPPDQYADPSSAATVTFAVTGAKADDETTSSCIVDGIGWIVCPVSNFLSGSMDYLFGILKSFMVVQPIQANQENPLYRGWSIMRNFANIAFIMAFLVIIYSQITSLGISNYGIKQLLPRIIVAAILVNISYWICAVAVDLSNIAGSGVYNILEGIRNDMVGQEAAGNTSWKALTGAILAGGAGAAAIGVGVGVTLASGGGAVMLLLPILVGVSLAALVAILILAARQALIVILVIIAPLAFVAYLLPNTEKLFDKWKNLFSTMLLLFPMFAGVFGGAQLAGEAIIQNAIAMEDDVSKLNLIILGMAVKIAPVVVTPFLLKFSGSLLGKIAGVVNNPGKGLVDRTRNWSQERADAYKAKQLANTKNPNFLARAAQGIDNRKRKRDGWKKANESRADANWTNNEAYRKIHGYDANTSQIKEIGENAANAHVAQMRATDAATQALDINARASKLKLDVSQARVDANWEEVKAGSRDSMVVPSDIAVSALATYRASQQARAQSILETSIQNTAETRRSSAAREVQQNKYAEAMINRDALQKQAGGIAGSVGADSALADAIVQKRKQYAEEVKAASELIKHFNLDGVDRQKLAMGKGDVTVTDKTTGAIIKVFKSDSKYMREAAIEAQLSGKGNYGDIEEIITNSGGSLLDYATTISEGIVSYKIAEKAPFMGGKTINAVSQGGISNENQLATAIAQSIAGGKIKAEHLVNMDQDALKSMVSKVGGKSAASLGLSGNDAIKFDYYMHQLGSDAKKARTDPRLNSRLAAGAVSALEKLERLYPPGSPPPPAPPAP